MADISALQRLREEHFFDNWNEWIAPELVASSEANVLRLIDDLIAVGPQLPEHEARRAVDECVRRFNDLDEDGWIFTIERDDIFEQIGRVVDLCGFDYDEEWVSEREW